MTFSGAYLSSRLIPVVDKIIRECGFRVNEGKTRLVGPKGRKIITGISVSSGVLKLPRSSRRMLRKEVFEIRQTDGNINALADKNDPLYMDRLMGRLAFWKQVEPNNGFVSESIEWLRSQY
jgi:hypothetical protein